MQVFSRDARKPEAQEFFSFNFTFVLCSVTIWGLLHKRYVQEVNK